MTSTAKLFTEKDGMPIHWEVQGENVETLTVQVNELMGYLDVNDFTGHTGFGQAPRPQPAQKATGSSSLRQDSNGRLQQRRQPAPKPQRDDVPVCDFCGGPVWDNRDSKRNPSQPDYKCRDKESCGGAGWIQEDGTIRWKE